MSFYISVPNFEDLQSCPQSSQSPLSWFVYYAQVNDSVYGWGLIMMKNQFILLIFTLLLVKCSELKMGKNKVKLAGSLRNYFIVQNPNRH